MDNQFCKYFNNIFENIPHRLQLEACAEALGLQGPTSLQKETLPIIFENDSNLLIQYCDNAGLKSLMLIELFHLNLSMDSLVVVLSFSKQRLKEILEVAKKINDSIDIKIPLRTIKEKLNPKISSGILFGTPSSFLNLMNNGLLENIKLIWIDQISIQIQFGFSEDLMNLGSNENLSSCIKIISIQNLDQISSDISNIINKILGKYKAIKMSPEFEQKLNSSLIAHYYKYYTNEQEKYLFLYCMFKLKSIDGKCLIYSDDQYKVKLFLEKFFIKSLILNTTHPINYQNECISSFNKGKVDILILPEKILFNIKLMHVTSIINMNPSIKLDDYFKRMNKLEYNAGTILTFFPSSESIDKLKYKLDNKFGENSLRELMMNEEVTLGFKYRVNDVFNSIKDKTIKNEMKKELKKMVTSSNKLKTYFESHPEEKEVIMKGIKIENPKNYKKHLAGIPEYLMPSEPLIKNNLTSSIGIQSGIHLDKMTLIKTKRQFPEVNENDLNSYSGRKKWKLLHKRRKKKKGFDKEQSFK